jgi:hypothetical protein
LEQIMVSEKAVYWIAVVVMVFGFSHTRIASHSDLTKCLTGRFESVADRVSSQADRLLSKTELPLELAEAPLERGQAQTAHIQARMACAQSMIARHQADFARLQANRARLMVMEQMHRAASNPMEDFVVKVPQINIPQPHIVVDEDGTL